MKSLKLLAEKYEAVQVQRSDEALIAAQTPSQLLEAFQELSQISNDVIVAFEHAITNRASLIKENTTEQDSDVRVAVLAMEKVLAHLDESKDEQFCLAFEAFAKNASLEEADLAVLSEAKGGFFSKLGKGFKKYAGKAASAVGKGIGAVAKGAGQLAGGLAGGVVGTGKSLAQGAKQGYTATKGATGPTASNATSATTQSTPAVTGAPVATQAVASAAGGHINKGDAEKAVDGVAAQIQKVQTKDRQLVIDYAIKKLAELKAATKAAPVAKTAPVTKAAKTAPVTKAGTSTTPTAKPTRAPHTGSFGIAESVESFYITTNKHFRK